MNVDVDYDVVSRPADSAYKRLWAAVLFTGIQDAAKDFQYSHSRYPEGFDRFPKGEPTYWFNSDEVYVGSFAWLCDLFDMDLDHARSAARSKFRELAMKRESPAATGL